MYNSRVKFGLKIPKHLGEKCQKTLGDFLTCTVDHCIQVGRCCFYDDSALSVNVCDVSSCCHKQLLQVLYSCTSVVRYLKLE